MNLLDYLPIVPDFPRPGIMFREISPLLAESMAFNQVIDELHLLAKNYSYDYIVGLESRGFIFASALAYIARSPLVMVRKPSKLPKEVFEESYGLEYGVDKLQIQKNILSPQSKVLLIDDVLATGGSLLATSKLVQQSESHVVGALTVLEITKLGGSQKLLSEGINNQSILKS